MDPTSEKLIRLCEWRWLLIATSLVLLLSSLPYIVAYSAQTPVQIFNGAIFDRQDYAVHLATMHLGERGEWAYRMRFTSESQQGAYVKLGYILLGHLARVLGVSLPLTYQISRLVFGAFACLGIYAWAAQCFTEVGWRRMAFLMAVLGAGLGWLQLIFGWLPQKDISPIDFWLIDGYVFFGILALPHFSAVTALLAGMLVGGISYLRRPARWKWLAVALAAVILQIIQPYAPVLADAGLLGAFAVVWLQRGKVDSRGVAYLFALAAVQAPLLVYNVIILTADPNWRTFVSQNVTLSPPLIYYIWGYGLLWLFAILGVIAWLIRGWKTHAVAWKSPEIPPLAAALVWVAVALLLAYSPADLQRRFMHAFTLPLALLATAGLREVISPWVDNYLSSWFVRRKIMAAVILVVVISMTSLMLGIGNGIYVLKRPAALFDPVELVRAADWLAAHANPDDTVLSTEQSGQLIAGRSGLSVYLGHPIETLDYGKKSAHVAALFSGADGGAWLEESGVRWVVCGPTDQQTDCNITPALPLVTAYDQGNVTIFQVVP